MKKARDLLKTLRKTFVTLSNPTITVMDPSHRYCYNPTLRWNPQVEEYFIKAYGADHFSRISESLTRPSCYSCIRVNTVKSTSDAVIEKLLAILQQTDLPSAINNINICTSDAATNFDKDQMRKSTLEESNSIQCLYDCSTSSSKLFSDSLKATIQKNPISRCPLPGMDYVLFVRGSGPHAVHYDYENDRPPKEVVVSRKCAEAVLRGAQVFVPGVLACSAHVEKGDTVAVSVAVEQAGLSGGWGVGITRGTVLQGLPTDPHFDERKGLYIGQGAAMMSRSGIFRVSQGVAVDMSSRVFNLPSFNDLLEGNIFLQNLPSIITAHALDPQQGERILDLCAAPGGKTTAIAILMKDKGEIVAVDRSHNKVLDIQKLAAEMGLTSITTYKLDALKSVCNESNEDIVGDDIQSLDSPTSDMEKKPSIPIQGLGCNLTHKENHLDEQGTNGRYVSQADRRKNNRRMKNGPGRNHTLGVRVEKCKGFSPNSFDRVLLDAPCSALGLRPRLFAGEETVDSLRKHATYQRRMFDQAVQLVRPGGVIIYSTCTINPGENEALVRYALDTYKFLLLASQHPRIGGPGLVGGCELSNGYFEEWLRHGEEDLVQRFDPSSPLDTIGFFIAKFNVAAKDA